MTPDTWYFAYGSNLSMDRKQERTGAIRNARLACLKGYRFAFSKGGPRGEVYANIVPSACDVVCGVVYLCNRQTMASLDIYEGVETGDYRKIAVEVETVDGELLKAEAYIAGDDFVVEGGRPSGWYLDRIVQGAKEHGLPADYVRHIEELAG